MPTQHGHRQGAEDADQAKWLAEDLEQKYRYDHTAQRWHHWDGVRWAPDKVRDLTRDVINLTNKRLKAINPIEMPDEDDRKYYTKVYKKLLEWNRIESALKVLATYDEYKTDGADWDQVPYLLGCQNGIVDLRVNALIENPGPELLVTKSTKHTFVPLTDWSWDEAHRRAPVFMTFLEQITSNDREMAAFLLLWYGY